MLSGLTIGSNTLVEIVILSNENKIQTLDMSDYNSVDKGINAVYRALSAWEKVIPEELTIRTRVKFNERV